MSQRIVLHRHFGSGKFEPVTVDIATLTEDRIHGKQYLSGSETRIGEVGAGYYVRETPEEIAALVAAAKDEEGNNDE